jgi:flagellar assembly protein FliH
VEGALRRVADRRNITVLVNPADHEAVSAALTTFAARGGGVERCEVRTEERVARAGAIVRTDEGEIDASVATQLQRAREVVEASLACAEPTA